MSKGTFFTGQPIFNQVLNFIPRMIIQSAARDPNADYRYESFKTYEHLITRQYSTFNHCNSLREFTTGILALHHRIKHLGVNSRHVDPSFLGVDPPAKQAINVRASDV